MKKVFILTSFVLSFIFVSTGLVFAQVQDTGKVSTVTLKDSIPNVPIIVKDSVPSIKKEIIPEVSTIPEVPGAGSSKEFYIPKYSSELKLYLDVYGTTMALPGQINIHTAKIILAYKFIGLGTPGFMIYTKNLFSNEDDAFVDSFKMAAFIAPIYLYYIPFASNRPTGDVLPFASYVYIGFSGWGMESGKLFDFGIGASCYVWDFNVGFNTVSAEGRDPLSFFNKEGEEDNEFVDYDISWSGIYASVTLSTGHWLSAWSKMKKKD